MLLVELETPPGVGFGPSVMINPESVDSVDAHDDHSSLVKTPSYTYIVVGSVRNVSAKLMAPEMLKRAGLELDQIEDLAKLIEENIK